jgi:hypothetical protein
MEKVEEVTTFMLQSKANMDNNQLNFLLNPKA